MAGNSETRQAKRLSVRAATEPLPTPLPPPPRPGRVGAVSGGEPGAYRFNSVPPPPHIVTRFPEVGLAQLETKTTSKLEPERSVEQPSGLREQPVPERSLASPGVIVALAASIAVMCAIGWYEKHGAEGFKWDAIMTFVQQWTIEPPASEEDLPYITSVPMTPSLGATESIAKDEAPSPKKNDQVLLSDLLKDDAAGTSDDDRTQLR